MSGAKVKVLYIAGNGRSGSTLLARALGQAEGFVSVGELKHVWNRSFGENQLCGCGRPFRACDFWQEVMQQAYGGLEQVDVARMRALAAAVDRVRHIPRLYLSGAGSDFQASLREYGAQLVRLYRAIQEVSGQEVVIDSSKEVSAAYVLDQLDEVELYILHLIRDSRGVANSWQRRKLRTEVVGEEEYMSIYSPYKSASRWMSWNALISARFARRPAPHYMRLRYEDFVRAPVQTLQGLVTAVGQKSAVTDFMDDNYISFQTVTHTVAGNPNRFEQVGAHIRFDDAWKSELNSRDRALTNMLTFPLLWNYGYLQEQDAPQETDVHLKPHT